MWILLLSIYLALTSSLLAISFIIRSTFFHSMTMMVLFWYSMGAINVLSCVQIIHTFIPLLYLCFTIHVHLNLYNFIHMKPNPIRDSVLFSNAISIKTNGKMNGEKSVAVCIGTIFRFLSIGFISVLVRMLGHVLINDGFLWNYTNKEIFSARMTSRVHTVPTNSFDSCTNIGILIPNTCSSSCHNNKRFCIVISFYFWKAVFI